MELEEGVEPVWGGARAQGGILVIVVGGMLLSLRSSSNLTWCGGRAVCGPAAPDFVAILLLA